MKRKLEKIEELDVNIDFDEASKCWRENKKVEINGMFSYICKYQLSKNKICGKPCYSKSINYPEYINSDITHMYCHKHFFMFLLKLLKTFFSLNLKRFVFIKKRINKIYSKNSYHLFMIIT